MKRALWIGLALACASALAVSWMPTDEAVLPVPRGQAPVPQRTPQVAETAPTPAGPAARTPWPAVEPAARAAWAPPPPPAPAQAPLPPAQPPLPPFPYQWLGQLQEGPVQRFLLASPQQTLAVVPGEVLEGRWRVEGTEGGRLRLTWLATGQTVQISLRGPTASRPDPT